MPAFLLAACLLSPAAAPQVPDAHLEGEVVLELRDLDAFAEGLAHHGLVEIFRDEEMHDLMAELGPWLAHRFGWLEKATRGQPLQLSFSLDACGLPRCDLQLGGDLAQLFPDGLGVEAPDSLGLALQLAGDPRTLLRDGPGVVLSAHWGEAELGRVRDAARRLLDYGNEVSVGYGRGPVFETSWRGSVELWRVGEDGGEDGSEEAVWVAFDEGSLVLSNQPERLLRAVGGDAPRLPQGLVEARRGALPGTLVVFADLRPLFGMALAKACDPRSERARSAMRLLGIDSWQWFALRLRPERRGFYARGHLEADGSRGLLGAFRSSLPAADLFASLPAGSQVAAAMALDPGRLFAAGVGLARGMADPEAEEIDAALARAGRVLGMEPGEFFGLFGDRASFAVRMDANGLPVPPDIYLEVALRDHGAAHVLDGLVGRWADSGAAPLTRTELRYGSAYQLPGGGPYSPAFVIFDDRVRLGSSAVALNQWLGEDPQPSGMQDVLAFLSHGSLQPVTGVVAVDLPELAAYGWRLGSPFLAGWLSQYGEDAPVSPASLPGGEVFRRNLPPFVRAFRVQERGLDFETHGLF